MTKDPKNTEDPDPTSERVPPVMPNAAYAIALYKDSNGNRVPLSKVEYVEVYEYNSEDKLVGNYDFSAKE